MAAIAWRQSDSAVTSLSVRNSGGCAGNSASVLMVEDSFYVCRDEHLVRIDPMSTSAQGSGAPYARCVFSTRCPSSVFRQDVRNFVGRSSNLFVAAMVSRKHLYTNRSV